MPVEDLIRSQLQSEEEFTDQHSSHFKLCIAVNFKSLWEKSAPSFDSFGTIITKLKLSHLKSLHFILAQSGNSIIVIACPLKSSCKEHN